VKKALANSEPSTHDVVDGARSRRRIAVR